MQLQERLLDRDTYRYVNLVHIKGVTFGVDRQRRLDMSASLIKFFEIGRVVWYKHIDLQVIFFQYSLVIATVLVSFFEIESEVSVLDSYTHAPERLFWVFNPAFLFLNKLASNANCTEI